MVVRETLKMEDSPSQASIPRYLMGLTNAKNLPYDPFLTILKAFVAVDQVIDTTHLTGGEHDMSYVHDLWNLKRAVNHLFI